MPFKNLNEYKIGIVSNETTLVKTSDFATQYHAIAALNAGFFDRDSGGSVCYFERNDSILSMNKSAESKWGKPDSLVNAALIVRPNSMLEIEFAQSEKFYAMSKEEQCVLVCGPLLLHHNELTKLPHMPFSLDRHPRSIIGITNNAILLITIDGRSKQAAGMSLYEVQLYAKKLGCTEAVNLDGGGSTTLWIKGKGIVNHPSDSSGERPVANVILIDKK